MNKEMNPKVDWFFKKETQWKEAFTVLRQIILGCGLVEDLKWGVPCYTYNGTNVVLIHGFKEYCALLFHKGVLLKDSERILIQQTKNVQAARQVRFTNTAQVREMKSTLKTYIYEAIEVEKAGLEVQLKKTEEFSMPEELQQAFDENPDLKAAFEALTPGRQRGYLLYFSQPKQSKTRISRIKKCTTKIYDGKGHNEQ